jgi:beta-glucosidase
MAHWRARDARLSDEEEIMFFRRFIKLLLSASLLISAHASIAQDVPYLDPTLDVEARVDDLLARMTLEEKIGQMTLVEKNSITPQSVTGFFIGGILSGGGGYPNPNTSEAWAEMVNGFQHAALSTRLGIPLIYGVDAVHGHNNLYGATIFPHNVGLGAGDNPDLVWQIGEITAREMVATGIYWNYAPVMAVPQDIRWGRTYEGFGEDTALVDRLANAYMQGLQGDLGDPMSVLATPKHYIGDGGTTWGTSARGNIDQGDTRVDEATLRARYLLPYIAAIENGAMSIMVSYSSWSGVPMHGHDYLINEVLKGELGFDGFVVSDWGGVDLIAGDYYDAVVMAINAGVDMNMVPQNYPLYLETLIAAIEHGDISLARIDDAVHRILRAKFMMGLFEQPFSDPALLDAVGSAAHRAVARQAVSESLVLLRNENGALPISKEANIIFVAGQGGNDIGLQSGGWTIEHGGGMGDITPGTTILESIEAAVSPETEVYFNALGRFNRVTDEDDNPIVADVGVVVLAEFPYAEWEGDNAFLDIDPADVAIIERMRERSEKLVVILLSGRPMIISDFLLTADAFVAAWLPGTEGQGIADVLFGDKPFTGKLPYTWPRTIEQIPFDFGNLPDDGCDAPLFPFGYGLTVEDASSSWLELAAACQTEND